MISRREKGQLLYGWAAALAVSGAFVAWAELSPDTLAYCSIEDGPIEYLTALLFLVSSMGFVITIVRSPFLSSRSEWWRHLFLHGWVLLMFVFAGEELSWGQRLFGFATPDMVGRFNVQNEFNLHNLVHLQSRFLLPAMIFITSVLVPLAALTEPGKKIVRRVALPVMPICYFGLFAASYVFGKAYSRLQSFSPELNENIVGFSYEVGELILAIGMAAFGTHGAACPDDLFRIESEPEADPPGIRGRN